MNTRKVNFNYEDSLAADKLWGAPFNCGPGAICAATGLTPAQLLPHMLGFIGKGYTNPTLAFDALKSIGVKHEQTYRKDEPFGLPSVKHGLVRIQWGGPWTKPGVPMRVRYRETHWAVWADDSKQVFDINAISVGGWISFDTWHSKLIPWLLDEMGAKYDGTYWPTHVIEVEQK